MELDGPELLQAFVKDPDDRGLAQAVAERLAHYLSRPEQGLDAAFGLRTDPGERKWWTRARKEKQHELIRDTLTMHFGNQGLVKAVEALSRKANQYETGRWRFDKDKTELPEEAAGTLHESLFEIFKAGKGDVPMSPRQLIRILKREV